MSNITAVFFWIANQPLWIQLIVVLLLFFVVFPIIWAGLVWGAWSIFRLAVSVFIAAIWVTIILGIPYLIWHLTIILADQIAYIIGSTLWLPYKKYELAREYSFFSLLILEGLLVIGLIWIFRYKSNSAFTLRLEAFWAKSKICFNNSLKFDVMN